MALLEGVCMRVHDMYLSVLFLKKRKPKIVQMTATYLLVYRTFPMVGDHWMGWEVELLLILLMNE